MKATELMIGDWLLFYDEDESQNIPVKIVGIDDDGWVFYEFPDGIREEGWCKKLYFIPITPEILEKNGFEKRYNYQWEYRDNSVKIVISVAPQIEIDGEIIGTPPINIMLEGALFNTNITSDCYVHDLQHCLKLCRIDKTIVL